MVDGGGLENRRAQAPGVRIPLPPSLSGLPPARGGNSLAPPRRRSWQAGYARLTSTPPAGSLLGRSVTGLVAADRLQEQLAVRALALASGGVGWVLVHLDASLLCCETAAQIRSGVAALGWTATVVATGSRSAPALSQWAEAGAYRRQVVSLAQAAARLAVGRCAPATLHAAAATLEADQADLEGSVPRLGFLDLLSVSSGPGRPRVLVAAAALPRLIDPYRGEVRPGVWAQAERAAGAALGEPVALLGLPGSGAQEAEQALQRGAPEPKVAAGLSAAVLGALAGPVDPLAPVLQVLEEPLTVATLPLPDRYDIRQAADRAEFGCEDGTPPQRVELTGTWRWLERLYEASIEGRSVGLELATVRIHLGALTLLGVNADLTELVGLRLAERGQQEPVILVSAANGRAGALVAQPARPTLRGARELEPFTDLWALAPTAVRDLATHLAEVGSP